MARRVVFRTSIRGLNDTATTVISIEKKLEIAFTKSIKDKQPTWQASAALSAVPGAKMRATKIRPVDDFTKITIDGEGFCIVDNESSARVLVADWDNKAPGVGGEIQRVEAKSTYKFKKPPVKDPIVYFHTDSQAFATGLSEKNDLFCNAIYIRDSK